MTPIRIRGPVWAAVLNLAAAGMLVVLFLLGGSVVAIPIAVILVVISLGSLLGWYLSVEEHQVKVRNGYQMTVRRIPVAGPGDLHIDGTRLVRASDGKQIGGVGPWSARGTDVALLRAAIAGAAAR